MSKIVITGGHLTPALATIDELKKQADPEIIYIGRSRTTEGDKAQSAESIIIPNMGIKFYSITPGRLQRRLTRYTFWALAKVPVGFVQALGILSRERPDIILSFGSYVAAPVVLAGWILGIPIITHEQTVKSGLSNRFVARFAKRIAVAWEKSLQEFPKEKTFLVGNPIRAELLKIQKKRTRRPVVYITGGNQGAHIINEMVVDILPSLLEICDVVHQTGGSEVYKDFETLSALSSQLSPKLKSRYRLAKWFGTEETVAIFAKTACLVGRSGANTVIETMALGIPAVFVPLPMAADGEQMKNAKLMESLGAAVILPQERLTPKRLLAAITIVIRDLDNFHTKARLARKNLKLNAAENLAKETLNLAK